MIPAINEIGFPSYATLHQATASFAEMGERTISTQVRIDGDVVPDFTGWELSFKGERFILNTKDPQAVKDNSTRNSLVDLTFVSWSVNELKRYFFFEPTSIDASTAIADKYIASVNLPVEDFAALFNKVLKYYFGDKVVFSLYMSGQGQYSTDRSLVEINYTYIWDVLVKFFEIYGVRWRIEYDESDDVYTIKAGWPTTDIDINDHDFEYGYKGGLVRFERQVQDVDIHNILLGRGGEKNIPYRYFKRIDQQNPDWAADPDAIPELANIYFDRLRDINFRWYVRGWMQNPNHDTSWEEDGYTYPSYTISSDSPYYFAYQKGRTDEKFNPVEYVKDDASIADYGEHWGALDDNDDIFPTIQSVSRDPLGRIDETVAVSEIVTDDISAMAQNAAVEKSINRMVVSNPASTTHTIRSEFFTIPSGTTGNIDYAWVGPTEGSGVVHIDTVQSSIVVEPESGGNDLPISGIPAGTYRLRLDLALYIPSGRSADGTFGLENIRLTTSSQETDAWKPTFDIWVKNIWGTEKLEGETDVQYAERVWLPILGDRVGNEAKIVFSTGFMSVSEDYEFPIVSYPVHDTSKSINGVPSEWRITLRKSDAEFDATGLYIPNASTGGKPVAGDKFFFIGIDMPFRYVTLAEEDLNTYKSAQLDTEAAISPTWIMNLDKVRVHTLEDQEYGLTLSERLAAGGKVWIKDKRFTPGERLQLYVQSITYTWNEPTVESPYIVPDIEVVLSDKVVAVDSVVQRIQNDVSSIKNQYARISDVEAVVRSVAEPIFLKKTGESDSSDSPTQFSSKVTSKGFRQGGVGGTGWGIYRDNTSVWAEAEAEAETRTRGLLRAVAEEKNTEGDTVFEADRIVVRKELQVNSLVINQISYLGGKEIISAAKIEVSKVIETDNGYVCYFDQRRNSVANNFVVNDIAMGQVFDPYNAELRYYKSLVTAVDIDSITISKTQKVGSGVPRVGDVIVQYGNTTQSGRQYVIVRDVVGGGYERMLSGLNSLNADGDEYYFAGRESSGTGPRWFVGSHEQNGDYAEYENGVLTIKANVVFKAGQAIPGMSELSGEVSELSNDLANLDTSLRSLTTDVDALDYLKTALPKSDTIITGGLILSKVIALRDTNNAIKSGINGDPTLSSIAAWYGGPMADKQASPTPASYAQSLFRFDGSGYLAGGNIYWNNQGYGGIPGITWSNDGTQDIVTIGANVRLASVDGDTVTDLLNAVNELMDLFEVVNGNIHVKNNRGFYSDSFISAGGISPGGGSAGGNATLVSQTYGGTLSATGINPINFYSKEKVDELLLTAGSVRSVAGVSPVSGDIPVASLKSALGLGAAAAYGVGSVASGNTGLVTGGDVWTAIDELPEPMVFKGSLGTGGTITSLPAASSANEGFTYKVITAGTYRGAAAKVGDTFISNGSSWILIPSGDEPEGTVTSVGLSMPTGFSVSSSPITSSGTLTVAFASGYSLPTTAKQSNWDTAYGWGNHANAGYLLASTAASTYATITALNGVSGRVTTLEGRTNWDTYFGVDENGDIYVKKNGTTARNFYSWGAVSAGGLSSGGGSEGASLAAVWASLKTNSDDYANEKINAYHIPIGSGLSVVNGLIVANNAGTVTSVKVGTTTYNPTDGVVSLPAYPTYSRGTAITISSSTISVAGTVDSEAISFDPDTHSGADASNPVAWGSASGTYGIKLSVNNVTKDLVLVSGYNALASRVTALENAPEGGITTIGTYQGAVTLGSNLSITENGVLSAVDTTYGEATTSAAGLMSADDKSKLSGIASGATNVTDSTVSGWGYVKSSALPGYASSDTAGIIKIGSGLTISDEGVVSVTGQTQGTVTRVDVGTSQYSPSSAGVVSLPAYPTTLPASDVSAWAKASTKPSYTFSELTEHPTTLSGYGITDAKIANGVITLGSNTITPLTAHQSLDGYVNALTRTPSSGGNYVASVTKSGKTITVTYATLPTALKNPNALTFGSKTYDGSEAKTITASDLGALTSHQTVTLASGTNNGTLKLTVGSTTTDNIAVKGLGSMAYASTADYVKLNPGAAEQTIRSSISTLVDGVVTLWRSSGDHYTFLGFSNGTTETYLGGIGFKSQADHNLYHKDGSNYYKVWDENNDGDSSGLDADLLDGQHGSYYATASSVSTLQGYFTNGVAKSAAKLTTVSKTAWGQTYWTSGGVPTSISGDMSSVGKMTFTAKTSKSTSGNVLEVVTIDGVTYLHSVLPFVSDSFVSAGGVSSGGGTSGVDLTAVWNNLIANTGEGLNKKIHTAHLPTVTITGTNISGTGTYSGTGGSASTLTLNLTAVDTTYSAGTGISLSGTTFSLNVAGAKTALGLKALAYKDSLAASDIPDLSGTYLKLAGGTMTGVLHAKANQYTDAYDGALDMANSDIYNLNSIYTADLSDSQAEGIHFFRTDTTVDTFRARNGVLYFAPDRPLGGNATEYTILHSGNYSSLISVTNAMLAGSIENSKLNTIGVAKGGTGLTTWTGAYRLIYSSAATTVTTLAPNTAATRKFLRMLGTGSAGAAPAWDTVTKTDVGLSNVPNWVYTIKDSSTQTFTA